MEKRMFAIFILSGLCHSSFSFYSPQYHFISDTKDWPSAQQYCREQYIDLATVTDENDLKTFADLAGTGAGPSVQTYVHIGLYRDWGWSRSVDDDYQEGEPAYWNWASGEPSVGLCGSISATGEWYAADCNANLSFFCYDALATDISQRFIPTLNPMNWLTAQTFCRTMYTDLARVRNQQENDLLKPPVAGQQMWLGLTKMSWRWSDGSEPSFIPWELSVVQSGDLLDCGAIVNSSNPLGLVQRHYTDLQPFICYSAPRKKLSLTLNLAALSSSVDMTDPAVRDSILTLVKKMLGGSSNDLNVSWQKTPRKINRLIHEKCPP